MKEFAAYVTCNPIIDTLIQIDSSQLEHLELAKNSMNLIDKNRYHQINEYLIEEKRRYEVGGSGMNTAVTLGLLGQKVVFNGTIGFDDNATILLKLLKEKNVSASIKQTDGDTATSFILMAEDASRTMNTHLGVSQTFGVKDVDFDAIKKSQYVYITAYCLDTDAQSQAVDEIIKHALKHDCKLVISLSDPFCVQRHYDTLQRMMEKAFLTIMNFSEAEAMLKKTEQNEFEAHFKKHNRNAIVTDGKNGAYLYFDQKAHHLPGHAVEVKDTTGAGDVFVAGFLHGLIENNTPVEAGNIACYLASLVVSKYGAQLSQETITHATLKTIA